MSHSNDNVLHRAYADFCRYVANYGFPSCPITEEQFNSARLMGADDGAMYGIACDVNAGVDFNVAAKLNIQRLTQQSNPAPTMNKVDMLNCAQGLHDYGDDSLTCRVCGHETPPAITTTPDKRDWQYVVANGDTELGFADWQEHQADANAPIPSTVVTLRGKGTPT